MNKEREWEMGSDVITKCARVCRKREKGLGGKKRGTVVLDQGQRLRAMIKTKKQQRVEKKRERK